MSDFDPSKLSASLRSSYRQIRALPLEQRREIVEGLLGPEDTMDEKLDPMDVHDLVVVSSYELRVREHGIGFYVVEAWREKTTGGERELFASATGKNFFVALKNLWQRCCG